ncbi:MAG: extracellular solute-binding protein [Anaerolineales bacterium]|nr:extracellular solute-binding protein [Anaerolineales bacterium]
MLKKNRIFLVLLLIGALSLPACSAEQQVVTVEVPGETIIQTVEVPGETIIQTEKVPGETVVETVEVQVPVNQPTITFWSSETQPSRAERTQAIIDRFTEKTGIGVELVLVDQVSMGTIMAANYAASTLPDVTLVPVTLVGGWYSDGILDAAAASEVIEALDESTFAQGALKMISVPEGYSAVPSAGWGQLLIYRADLFEQFGLEPPTDYDKIMAAAIVLEENGITGIMAGTDPGHPHTQSTFEHFSLGNGVHLTDGAGNITLNTPEMITAIEVYADLMANYGPKDTATFYNQTRAAYLAGEAGMVLWSPFLLDEMAGLVDSSLPNCPECSDDPAFIAKNSDFVSALSGPDGGPAQFGKVQYMGITTGADTEATKQFVEFWLSDGYLDWLAVAPEGKFPMRRGTVDDPTAYIDGWAKLEVGVDHRASLSDFYSEEELQAIVDGADSLTMLGVDEGEMELISAIYEDLVIPRAVGEVIEGVLTPEEAAQQIQTEVEELQAALAEQ